MNLPPFESNSRGTRVDFKDFPGESAHSTLEQLVRIREVALAGLVKLGITDQSIVGAHLEP